MVNEAEEIISNSTGFTPQEIIDYMAQLEKEYQGKETAPFEVELY